MRQRADRPSRARLAPPALSADIRRWREWAGVPGVAVVLVDAEGATDILVDGLADVERSIPVRPDHRFQIGSITKSLTAIALLRVAELGRLRPDDLARRRLPWFRAGEHSAAMTIHHLLTHTAGLPSGADSGDASAYDVWALREAETLPPGNRYWYSNAGYKALSLILASVADAPFPEALRRGALEPLGMDDAQPAVSAVSGEAERGRHAVGYEPEAFAYPRSRARRVVAPSIEMTLGDGSVTATAHDMARYAVALLGLLIGTPNADKSLLTAASRSALFGRHVRSGPDSWYGYGISSRRDGRRWIVGHSGDTLGFAASLRCDPAAGVGVAVLANLRAAPTAELARHALAGLGAGRAGQPAPRFEPPTSSVPWAALTGLVGRAGAVRVVPANDAAGPYFAAADGAHQLIDRGSGRFEVDHPSHGRYVLRVEHLRGGRTQVVHGANVYRPGTEISRDVTRRSTRGSSSVPSVPGTYRSHNPWRRVVDVLDRDGHLVLVEDDGEEAKLVRLGAGRYRIGQEPNPERIAFDALVDGRALRATVGGGAFARDV